MKEKLYIKIIIIIIIILTEKLYIDSKALHYRKSYTLTEKLYI